MVIVNRRGAVVYCIKPLTLDQRVAGSIPVQEHGRAVRYQGSQEGGCCGQGGG